MAAGTLLSGRLNDGGLDLAAAGSWTAEHARALEPMVDDATRSNAEVRRIVVDVTRVERLDTYGAWLIERTLRVPDQPRRRGQGCRPVRQLRQPLQESASRPAEADTREAQADRHHRRRWKASAAP